MSQIYLQVDSIVVIKNNTNVNDVMGKFNEVFGNTSDETIALLGSNKILSIPMARKLVSDWNDENCRIHWKVIFFKPLFWQGLSLPRDNLRCCEKSKERKKKRKKTSLPKTLRSTFGNYLLIWVNDIIINRTVQKRIGQCT